MRRRLSSRGRARALRNGARRTVGVTLGAGAAGRGTTKIVTRTPSDSPAPLLTRKITVSWPVKPGPGV